MEHLSLLELNKLIGTTLANNLEPSYWVIAEIGEIKLNQKGHCYLELIEKDGDMVLAKTRATIWSYTYRNLITWFESITGQSLKAGMSILFNATIQYHEIYGLSLNIRDIDAQFTLGERARRKNEIINQLREDGVFDMNKELPLPVVPQRIAIISAESAAGYGDFMNQLTNNEFGYQFQTELFQAIMQGQEASSSLIAAMHNIYERAEEFDVLAIVRGGGAAVDLDCFDNYDLCCHIAQFPIPVITGIGHERDETITDLVAHTKMKTPTAVSEFIISGVRSFESKLDLLSDEIVDRWKNIFINNQLDLEKLSSDFRQIINEKINHHGKIMNSIQYHLQLNSFNILRGNSSKLDNLTEKIKRSPVNLLEKKDLHLSYLESRLKYLNPENILKRGYSLTTINGVNINKVKKIEPGDILETITKDIRLESEVKNKSNR